MDFNSPQPDDPKSSLDTDGGHDSVAESPAGGGAGGSTSPGQRRGGLRPGAGRKPIEFDLETATKLGTLGCSNKELAAFVPHSPSADLVHADARLQFDYGEGIAIAAACIPVY